MTEEMKGNGAAAGSISAEDEVRLAALPAGVQEVARKHGRGLFELIINSAAISEDMQVLMQLTKARDARARVMRIAQAANNLTIVAMRVGGWTQADTSACKADLDAAIVLAVPVRPPGSVILLN